MASESLYREICRLEKLEFAICDEQYRVYEYSRGISEYILPNPGPIRGRHLSSLFDELWGIDTELGQLQKKEIDPIKIEKIVRQTSSGGIKYVTLTVSSFRNEFLILLSDVTPEAVLEQRVTQQRNNLDLLAGKLTVAHNQLNDLLHRFVPHEVAEQMIANPKNVKPGGERQDVTVLFADLRGFTSWAEHKEPEEVLAQLNLKLSIAVDAVIENGGILDKYMGDAIMGVFNAPTQQADHVWRAVQAAWQFTEFMLDDPDLSFGVGINTGSAVVGNIGTMQAMNYTAVGDVVNQAKRLQELARGNQIFISAAALEYVRDLVDVFPLGKHQLHGRLEETDIYQITGLRK